MEQSFDDPSNLYKVLGVPKNADDETIKKAYRKLALKHHPDRHHGGTDNSSHIEKFQCINTAHKILSDKGKRRIYDTYGMKGIQLWEGHNADALPNFIFKKWFKPVFYTLFLLSCCCCFCCCGCLCCCGFCCNFCCGKYAPKGDYEEEINYDLARNDDENGTQRDNVSETQSYNATERVDDKKTEEEETSKKNDN
ncbi:DnaJ domain-containing protein [Strongyloides ratti]|uniref:DnaJ domain-containing protein n=1 Tax=Strongyloides ratti TaxID=34506 RepID=A0A090N0H4_STRRB|nr:DnaJ domain-containing protein [Strongyloides ratti]CEF70693.1 DnaJ domain-containing protein [Strongyloides ratti]